MDQVEIFVHRYPLVQYPAGTKLFTDQQNQNPFLYIQSGCIEMSTTNEEGQEIKLHIFYPGSCVSLLSLVEPSDSYDFTTLTNVEAYKIPHDVFLQTLHRNPEMTYQFLVSAMKGMKGLLYRIQHTASASAYQRVASLLLYFAKHTNSPTLSVPLTHQEISEWLGLSRENVSIQMKKLERDGLIAKAENHIVLLDPPRLKALTQAS